MTKLSILKLACGVQSTAVLCVKVLQHMAYMIRAFYKVLHVVESAGSRSIDLLSENSCKAAHVCCHASLFSPFQLGLTLLLSWL